MYGTLRLQEKFLGRTVTLLRRLELRGKRSRVHDLPWASGCRGAILIVMRILWLGLVVVVGLAAQIRTGPDIGSVVPAFEAVDQNGHLQTLQSVAGPKGALLVFYRSADW